MLGDKKAPINHQWAASCHSTLVTQQEENAVHHIIHLCNQTQRRSDAHLKLYQKNKHLKRSAFDPYRSLEQESVFVFKLCLMKCLGQGGWELDISVLVIKGCLGHSKHPVRFMNNRVISFHLSQDEEVVEKVRGGLILILSWSNTAGIQPKGMQQSCHLAQKSATCGCDVSEKTWPQPGDRPTSLTCKLSQGNPLHHGSRFLRVTPVNSSHVCHNHGGVHSVHPNLGPEGTNNLTQLLWLCSGSAFTLFSYRLLPCGVPVPLPLLCSAYPKHFLWNL